MQPKTKPTIDPSEDILTAVRTKIDDVRVLPPGPAVLALTDALEMLLPARPDPEAEG